MFRYFTGSLYITLSLFSCFLLIPVLYGQTGESISDYELENTLEDPLDPFFGTYDNEFDDYGKRIVIGENEIKEQLLEEIKILKEEGASLRKTYRSIVLVSALVISVLIGLITYFAFHIRRLHLLKMEFKKDLISKYRDLNYLD